VADQPSSLGDRLRRVTWSRVAFMVALLTAGFVLVKVAGHNGARVGKDDALAIARQKVDFEPTGYQIRFIRRGIPSRGFWVASFYIQKETGGYSRVTVVLVDAATGKVTEVRKTE
jgi:hypothetical protein